MNRAPAAGSPLFLDMTEDDAARAIDDAHAVVQASAAVIDPPREP